MAYQDILVETQDQIGTITLNSPSTINALSKNMIKEVTQALESFSSDSEAKVIVLKANGKHFCSGHNLREMVNRDQPEYRLIFEQCTRMMSLIHKVPQMVLQRLLRHRIPPAIAAGSYDRDCRG